MLQTSLVLNTRHHLQVRYSLPTFQKSFEYFFINYRSEAHISSDLSRSTAICASFGISLGMTPRSTKKRSIPRYNTTGDLSFQDPSISTPVSSPTSTCNASSRRKQYLPLSQSSNTLILPTKSRIPTPVRANPCENTLSMREPSMVTYTYTWTHDASATTTSRNKRFASGYQTLPDIDVNIVRNLNPVADQSPVTSQAPKPITADTRLPLDKVRQVQNRPASHSSHSMVSICGQAASPYHGSAKSLQTLNSKQGGNIILSRPSLPLKVRSSHDMSAKPLYPNQASRAVSGSITHFSSKVVNLDDQNVNGEKRSLPRISDWARQEASDEIKKVSPKGRQIHLVRSLSTLFDFFF